MDFMQRKNSRGFTLLELMIVVVIVGILAAGAITFARGIVHRHAANISAVGFFKELQALPAMARKSNAKYYVQFSAVSGAASYEVYKDNGNGAFNSAEDLNVQVPEQPNLVIGRGDATGTPASWISTDVIHGNWDCSAQSGTDVITCSNDVIGSIRNGHVYIYSKAYPSAVYCVAVRSGYRSVQLFQWNGGSWKEM